MWTEDATCQVHLCSDITPAWPWQAFCAQGKHLGDRWDMVSPWNYFCVPFSSESCLQQHGIMMFTTANYWQWRWHWTNGDIGWKEPDFPSSSTQITATFLICRGRSGWTLGRPGGLFSFPILTFLLCVPHVWTWKDSPAKLTQFLHSLFSQLPSPGICTRKPARASCNLSCIRASQH